MTTRQRMAAAASLSPALYDLHVCAEGLALLSPAQLEEKDLRTLIAIDYLFESIFDSLSRRAAFEEHFIFSLPKGYPMVCRAHGIGACQRCEQLALSTLTKNQED